MSKKVLTLRDVQKWQRQKLPHNSQVLYNAPLQKIGEMGASMWRLETLAPFSEKPEVRKEIPEQIKAMLAAVVLQIADYCNAKGYDLESVVTAAMDRIAIMEGKE